MKTIRLAFALSLATSLFAAYQYSYSDVFTPINANWIPVGPAPPQTAAGGLTGGSYFGVA